MDTQITERLYDEIPDEFLNDPTNPANDQFVRQLARLQSLILAESANMYPDQVTIVKMHHRGCKTSEIASELNLHAATIRNTLKRPRPVRLTALLSQYALLQDSPNAAHRRGMLWRIAARNEIDDARVSLSAIGEMNKMEHNEKVLAAGGAGNQPINISINQTLMPRGALDK
jgi:hypothetical protein